MAVINGTYYNDNLNGTNSDDTINASYGNDVVYGMGGNDSINGGDGNDLLDGGAGNDIIIGDLGNDNIYGRDGNDTINGGHGLDMLDGGAGNDVFEVRDVSIDRDQYYGGSGFDQIKVYEASYAANEVPLNIGVISEIEAIQFIKSTNLPSAINAQSSINLSNVSLIDVDRLRGSALSDNLTANTVYNTRTSSYQGIIVDGLGGNDYLTGSNLNDTLLGGDGDDKLYGLAGNDILTGGAGNDTFYFANSAGQDNVTDFVVGNDKLDFSAAGARSSADLSISQNGSNTLIGFGSNTVTLTGIDSTTLTTNEFVFAS